MTSPELEVALEPARAIAPETGTRAPMRKTQSLQVKGFVATLCLFAYLSISLVYVSLERAQVYDGMAELEAIARHEKTLALLDAALENARRSALEAIVSSAGISPAVLGELPLFRDSGTKLFAELEELDPAYALTSRAIRRSYDALKAEPSREGWLDFRVTLARAGDEVEIRHRELVERREAKALANRRKYDAVTVESLLLGLVGIAAFGSLVAYFFARLTRDIRLLEVHARRIVHGARGVSMPVTRSDELGRLMTAVNQITDDLSQREKQLQLEVQRSSHQDKMLAVGALAAGMAHEVNNPLAVVSGLLQELAALDRAVSVQELSERARQMISQVQRAASAARRLAEAAAPQPPERDWTDLNEMVRRVTQLMAYDRRYRHIAFDLDLDPRLPAVLTVGDAIQQVLMQVVTLGCDALGHATERQPRLRLRSRSRVEGLQVQISVPVAMHIKDDEWPRNVALGRAIVEPLGGWLTLGQGEDGYRYIRLVLPAQGGVAQG